MAPALLALLVASAPATARTYALDPASSVLRYHVVHRLHRVTGVTSSLEGKAVLHPDGKILAMVRAPVASFDSGDRNRDLNMQEAVEAGRFPFVVFKGVARLDGNAQAAMAQATSSEARMEGEVELHGVRRPVEVPLRIELAPDGTARARGTLQVSLESFGVERPSLFFVKIEDGCRIEVDFLLREQEP
jgi:polyisoprenoid-binding protein YceI